MCYLDDETPAVHESPEVYETPQPLQELVGQVQRRKWHSVWIADDSAAFLRWYYLYKQHTNLRFSDLFRREVLLKLAEAGRIPIAGRKVYLELLASQVTQQLSFAEIEQWLDDNVQLMPGLQEFVSALPRDQGLVIVADNFGRFVRRILSHYGLDLPFIASELNEDGTVATVSERDGYSKEKVCNALIAAGIWVNGIAGTFRTINGSVAEFAYDLEVPLVCLTRHQQRRNRAAECWSVMPYLQRVTFEPGWGAMFRFLPADEHVS